MHSAGSPMKSAYWYGVSFRLRSRRVTSRTNCLPRVRGLIKGHGGPFITGLTGLFIACIPGAWRSDGRRQRGRHDMAMGRCHHRPHVRWTDTCCVVAPVADDRKGLGRHKPPPVGVCCKSGCDRGLQTPVPRWRGTCLELDRKTHCSPRGNTPPTERSPLRSPSSTLTRCWPGRRNAKRVAVRLPRAPCEGIGVNGRRCGGPQL